VTAFIKSVLTTILIGGVLIASFYFAYILIVLTVVALAFGVSWLFFNWHDLFEEQDFPD